MCLFACDDAVRGFEKRYAVTYHVVTVESLHDGGFVQELDPLAQAGRLVHRLDGDLCVRVSFDDVLGDSLVHHAEGALTELSEHRDLVPGNFPLIGDVHYTQEGTERRLNEVVLHK